MMDWIWGGLFLCAKQPTLEAADMLKCGVYGFSHADTKAQARRTVQKTMRQPPTKKPAGAGLFGGADEMVRRAADR